MGDILHGMKEICHYARKSECTVLDFIRLGGMNATKVGGEWVSSKQDVDNFYRGKIEAAKIEDKKPKKKNKARKKEGSKR